MDESDYFVHVILWIDVSHKFVIII
jgi:hypothetical protein